MALGANLDELAPLGLLNRREMRGVHGTAKMDGIGRA